MQLQFGVLGPLEVADNGRRLEPRAAKQRTLLGVLVLHANETVSRERLIDELWGPAPPPSAVKALQTYVSELRRALGDGVVVTRPPGYALAVDPDQIDAARFARGVEEARRLAASGRPEAALTRYREALSLWRGPALADVGFESFARNETARLEELRMEAVGERIDCELAAGHHRELVGELETLVAQHPLREGLRAQLVLGALSLRPAGRRPRGAARGARHPRRGARARAGPRAARPRTADTPTRPVARERRTGCRAGR